MTQGETNREVETAKGDMTRLLQRSRQEPPRPRPPTRNVPREEARSHSRRVSLKMEMMMLMIDWKFLEGT